METRGVKYFDGLLPGLSEAVCEGKGRDTKEEVYVLTDSALGPSGTTGVVLKVARPSTGRS
ncbi:MAG: hypothetical protein M1376_13205 [Planctomycetes bacterium]|nr:hypothetical protein [Planctomycetota bacterium]